MAWKSWRKWAEVGLRIGSYFVPAKPVSDAMERAAEDLGEAEDKRKQREEDAAPNKRKPPATIATQAD